MSRPKGVTFVRVRCCIQPQPSVLFLPIPPIIPSASSTKKWLWCVGGGFLNGVLILVWSWLFGGVRSQFGGGRSMNDGRSKSNGFGSNTRRERIEDEETDAWGIMFFSLIGATATTLAVVRLRRTVDWFYTELLRSSPFSSRKSTNSSSYYRRYNRRMQEEYEEEMERVERIRRMQNVFNRERNKYKKNYESWREHGTNAYQYHQHFQRDDWYWKSDTSYRHQRADSRTTPRDMGSYTMSHHYSVLGLDRLRTKPYSDAEIKSAFRAKAKKYHPDQNQDNKEVAEAKFKEVMTSYEAIKLERGNGKISL